ncbi:MAG: ATP-binding cassette domain-containing protein, partial [Nanoarchaeota archaeon]|nr:ATP-binding cassette domain-containing protein [Nanoarchaeota archaeon]
MSRLAIIDNQKIKHRSEKEYIQSLCPMNRTGSDCMYFEGEKLLIDEILCTGCGICVKAAPNAIKIINLPELSNKDPIHQFGQNGFRIFSLPLIQENSITGIIGRNGIGKSTIINILSNTTKANFAKFGEKEIKKDKEYFAYLNDLFKGTALQNYFNKLENKEIRVAYKPQQIINIPQIFNGKVIELLNKVSTDKKQIEKLCKELNIYNTLERDIKVVSGGELQRIAICAALLKDESNLFIFDEITNYLDIYERLNTSKLIKHKTKGKSAIVVEHDLIVLDYLADFVNIVYGEQGGYGMLTGIKAAKVGINNYLEGFSKEENVRFRDKSITFDKESAGEAQRIDILTTWEESQIKAGTFKLEIEKG